jgi:hypothetical protein
LYATGAAYLHFINKDYPTARQWLQRDSKLTRQQAVDLVENLMWRGISGFPSK